MSATALPSPKTETGVLAGARTLLYKEVLRFKTDKPLPPSLAPHSRVTGRIAQITAHDAVEVEQVLATLRNAGVVPEDLEIGRADLEDVFLEIMQGVVQ